jgi:hypothetical protein
MRVRTETALRAISCDIMNARDSKSLRDARADGNSPMGYFMFFKGFFWFGTDIYHNRE